MTREEAQRQYDQLISSRKKEILVKSKDNPGLIEIHHIVPLSIGGKDVSENRVALFAREHFMAHVYLWVIHKDTSNAGKMACALTCMQKGRNYKPELAGLVEFSKEYHEARCMFGELSAESMRKRMAGCGNVSFGKHWFKDPNSNQCAMFSDGMQPEGWVRGRYVASRTFGLIWVCNEALNLNKRIKAEDVQVFILDNPGWRLGHIGRRMSAKAVEHVREASKIRIGRTGTRQKGMRKYVNAESFEIKLFAKGEPIPGSFIPFNKAMVYLHPEQKAKALMSNKALADKLRAEWLASIQEMADFYSTYGYEMTCEKFNLNISRESMLMKFIRCWKLYGLKFVSKLKVGNHLQ